MQGVFEGALNKKVIELLEEYFGNSGSLTKFIQQDLTRALKEGKNILQEENDIECDYADLKKFI